MMRRPLLFLLFPLLLLSCSNERPQPEGLLDEPLYLELSAELYLTMQLVQLREIYEQEDSLRQIIFDHYGVKAEQFRTSHRYYEENIDGQLIRLDSLRTRFDREERRINEFRLDS